MPRAGLTTAIVTDSAAQIADEVGLQGLTLAAVAQQLGVRLPSLYKHVDGTSGLQREIALRAKTELADVLRRAAVGRSREDALRSVARAYRTWASEHPGQYQATVRAAAAGDTADYEAGLAAAGVVFDILAGYGLTGDDAVDATRALRAALHGFVLLEASDGFGLPADVDRSFTRLVEGLVNTIGQWSVTAREATS